MFPKRQNESGFLQSVIQILFILGYEPKKVIRLTDAIFFAKIGAQLAVIDGPTLFFGSEMQILPVYERYVLVISPPGTFELGHSTME